MTTHASIPKDGAAMHIVLAQAVVFKDGKALIAQRSFEELQSPGLWSLPGGKVERYGIADSVIEKTLQAEFREEVGIELANQMEYLASGSFVRKDGLSVVTLCFLADWKAGEAEPLEDSIAVAWVGEGDLAAYEFAPSIEPLIKLAFSRRG